VYPIVKQVSRAKRADSLYYLNVIAHRNPMKDENPIVISTEKLTEKKDILAERG